MMTFKNDINSEGLLLVSPFVLYINKRIRLTPNLSNVTVIKYTDDTCIIGCITNLLNQIEIIYFIPPRPSNEGSLDPANDVLKTFRYCFVRESEK